MVSETNIFRAPSRIHGRQAVMVHFTALTFFPCYGRLPLSVVYPYSHDTLAALFCCYAGDFCASLDPPEDPPEATV